ncbi:MAG: hypothetical protein ACRDIU_02225 [Actinomycetota bacterium]
MRRQLLGIICAVVALAALTSVATPATAAPEGLAMHIGPIARLVEEGRGIVLEIYVSCAPGDRVIEAFAYASQPDESGGGAYSGFSGIPVRCTGQTRTYFVTARTFEGEAPFKPGPANASSYLLVSARPDGPTSSTGDFEVVQIIE